MNLVHLSDEELERYVSGMVHHDSEMEWVEKHLYVCPECEERMFRMQEYQDSVQAGLRLDGDEA
jgi:anti-sigma factor RsiW